MKILRVLALNFVLSLLVILLVAGLLWLDRLWPALLPAWAETAAIPLFVLGSAMIVWAVITLFQHSGTSGAPGDPTTLLVTSGPYRWMRNPIYAGDVILVFGVAWFTRSPTLLLATFLLLPFLDLFVRKVEEPRTAQRLGEAYTEYLRHVPRWFPRRPKE